MMDTNDIPMIADVSVVRLAVSCESIVDRRYVQLVSEDLERRVDLDVRERAEREDEASERAHAEARNALRHYMRPILDAIDEDEHALVDIGEDAEPSEYDAEWLAYHGSAHIDVEPATWLRIADGYCLDLDYVEEESAAPNAYGQRPRYRESDHTKIPALPAESIAPTLGILGADGITPAVAVESTDEGWSDASWEPTLLASFYVALMLRESEDA